MQVPFWKSRSTTQVEIVLLAALAQQHRRLDRERRRADPAGRREEGEDLAAVLGQARRRLERADAGFEDLLRLDRLAQKVGEADLKEPAHQRVVEGIGEHDHRRTPEAAHRNGLEGDEALPALRVDVDDHHRGRVDLRALARLLHAFRQHPHGAGVGRAGGRRDSAEQRRVRADKDDRRAWCVGFHASASLRLRRGQFAAGAGIPIGIAMTDGAGGPPFTGFGAS